MSEPTPQECLTNIMVVAQEYGLSMKKHVELVEFYNVVKGALSQPQIGDEDE